jgi:hypothetical protein
MDTTTFEVFTSEIRTLPWHEVLRQCEIILGSRDRPYFYQDIAFLHGFLLAPRPLSLATMNPDLYQGVWRVVDALEQRGNFRAGTTLELFLE